MSDLMFWTLLVFAILSWIAVLTVGLPYFVGNEFQRHGYDPIDYDALQAELDEEFGR